MKHMKILTTTIAAALMTITSLADAAEWVPSEPGLKRDMTATTLITNVNIFNGTDEALITGKDVVIKGNKIDSIIASGGNTSGYGMVIDGKDGYLSPGLIDVHWHSMMPVDPLTLITSPLNYVAGIAAWESEERVKRGVTTVRDAGGATAGLKKAIDEGYVTGPRIYPSQAVIGQYSGHVDFRNPNFMPKEWGGPRNALEQIGLGITANGVDSVLQATRDNLYKGASQIKMAVTGGVISFADPLYVKEFLPEEIEAAVKAAADYDTYVFVHAHSPGGIKRAINAGVQSVDHNSLADEEAIKLMAEKGTHMSVQVLVAMNIANQYPKGDVRQQKAQQAVDGTDAVMKWTKKHGVKQAWGTDLLDSLKDRAEQLHDLTIRTKWFTSAELMV
ncbi:MAG: amidohydrolase family protein [Xanthomonadales bacterium]|nr:amidohydrolase family protein [Xanthomonadales bacterium]